jgi:peptidoglycan/LPS O-acetylase OafA/YrhL
MSVEELFYLLSPLIFLYTKRISSLVKFIILFYLLGILITFFFSTFPAHGFFNDYNFTANFTFFGRVFEFACGIGLGMLVKGKIKHKFGKTPGKIVLYAGLSIIMASVTMLYLIAKHYHIMHAIDVVPGILVNNLLMPVGIVLIFYSLIYQKSLLQKFLASKILVALGNSTYSFYLLHTTFVLSYIYKYVGSNILVVLIMMIFVSYVFHKSVEQPLADVIRRKFLK